MAYDATVPDPAGSGIVKNDFEAIRDNFAHLEPVAGRVDELVNLEDAIINVKDFGAVGDGVTDDTQAIQNAFDSINEGLIFFPTGEYLITSGLNLSTNKSIKGVGNKSIIKANINNFRMVRMETGTRMYNLVLDGQRGTEQSNQNDSTGVFISSEDEDIIIENCVIKNTVSDGIYSLSSYNTAPDEYGDIIVKNTQFINCGRQGLAFVDTVNATIESCTFKNNRLTGVNMEAGAGTNDYTKSLRIINNYCLDNNQCGIWYQGPQQDDDSGGLTTITNNVVINSGQEGVKLTRAIGISLSNNIIYNCQSSGIYLADGLSKSVISNNVIENNSGYGISFRDTKNIIANANVIINNGSDGMRLHRGSTLDNIQPIISNNNIQNNSGYGIRLFNYNYYDANKLTLTGNRLSNNTDGSWRTDHFNKWNIISYANFRDDATSSPLLVTSSNGSKHVIYVDDQGNINTDSQ